MNHLSVNAITSPDPLIQSEQDNVVYIMDSKPV